MPESTPLRLSVVTPAYNQAAYLRDTIESVLSQDYSPIEYQVIDDGSTDATRKVLEEYTGRIHWETQPNMGQTPTINKGWQRATGDVLTWLNSDDTFLPNAVRTAMDYLASHPDVGIVFGDTLFTQADGTPIERSRPCSGYDYERLVVKWENPIPQPSAFIRRSVIEDVGLLDSAYYYFMDWDLWLSAGIRHRIAYIPQVLSTYRLHAESKTLAQARRAAPELEYMCSKYFGRPDVPDSIRRQRRLATANMFFTSGGYYLKGSARSSAIKMLARAVSIYPELLLKPAMLHQSLYLLLGETACYQLARSVWRRFWSMFTASNRSLPLDQAIR